MTREEVLKIAKPILFNTDMVRAILDGRKTVTRQVVKGFIPNDAIWGYTIFTPKGYISCRGTFADGYGEKFFKLPYNTDDILYVRETWCNANKDGVEPDYYYFADTRYCEDYNSEEWKWRPSIHMPKEAARIFLKVANVRVERLQDIMKSPSGANNQVVKEGFTYGCDFVAVWNSTIKKKDLGKYGWDANPWVWIIEFEKMEVE